MLRMMNEGVRSLTSNLDTKKYKIKHFSHKIVLFGFSLGIKKSCLFIHMYDLFYTLQAQLYTAFLQ